MSNPKKDMVKELVSDLVKPIQEYRKSIARDPNVKTEAYLLEGLEDFVEELDRKHGVYSEVNVTLNAADYWADVIRAKIEIIGITGGKELMSDIYEELEKLHDNDKYDYQPVFSIYADGISGWYH